MTGYRYGAYQDGPDPLASPYDARGALDELGDAVQAGSDAATEMRDLLGRGLQGGRGRRTRGLPWPCVRTRAAPAGAGDDGSVLWCAGRTRSLSVKCLCALCVSVVYLLSGGEDDVPQDREGRLRRVAVHGEVRHAEQSVGDVLAAVDDAGTVAYLHGPQHRLLRAAQATTRLLPDFNLASMIRTATNLTIVNVALCPLPVTLL